MIESKSMKRFGHPEEVAKALVFLAFEETFTSNGTRYRWRWLPDLSFPARYAQTDHHLPSRCF
jgi:hypothetical protein